MAPSANRRQTTTPTWLRVVDAIDAATQRAVDVVAVGAPSAEEQELRAVAGLFARRFRIERLLGQGGMSTVWLAWEYALERHVAVKLLSPALRQSLEDRGRFRREARVHAGVVHPHVVAVHQVDEAEGVPFVVLDYVPGETLAQRLAREGRVAPEAACLILRDLADALTAVHGRGIVHRDLKPENVLLDERTGRARLTDFGVATVRTSDHSLSEVCKALGTPDYMSPEHAMGEQAADGRSDLYSLGVIGFQMLAGRLPFAGACVATRAAQRVVRDAPPVEGFVVGLPDGIAEVVDRCLHRDPRRRYPDAVALRDALDAALREARAGAGSAAWRVRLRRAVRRRLRRG